jgi:hypothetical protein
MDFEHFKTFPLENDTTISQEQLKNAKIYSNRWSWIESLKKNINILEIGVAAGDYSQHMVDKLNPNNLYLVDTFTLSDITHIARPGQESKYQEGQAFNFVVNRFANNKNVKVFQSNSHDFLPELVNKKEILFDMIYIDAHHKFESVYSDLMNSVQLLRDDGVIALNDYVDKDTTGEEYDVIKVVNRFLHLNKDWEVIGLALEERMYADLYIKKIAQPE